MNKKTQVFISGASPSGFTAALFFCKKWCTASADFLLGCEGAHSTIRHKLNFSFEGGAYDGDFILGDVQVLWTWDKKSISLKPGALRNIGLGWKNEAITSLRITVFGPC